MGRERPRSSLILWSPSPLATCGCGLAPAASGMLESLNGWFGRNVGAPSRVALACRSETAGGVARGNRSLRPGARRDGAATDCPVARWLATLSRQSRSGEHPLARGERRPGRRSGLDRHCRRQLWPAARTPQARAKALAAVTAAVKCPVLVSVGELPAAQADLAERHSRNDIGRRGRRGRRPDAGEGYDRRWNGRASSRSSASVSAASRRRVVKPGAPTEFTPSSA